MIVVAVKAGEQLDCKTWGNQQIEIYNRIKVITIIPVKIKKLFGP